MDNNIDNVKTVMKLVEMFPEQRRSKVKKMLDGKIGEIFFTAPASSREDFHNAFPGGLCQHSLNVVKNVWKLTAALEPNKYDKAVLAFVGLFHDLGKVGDGEEQYYTPNESDWHRQRGMLYTINKDCKYAPHSERGLYILQSNDIRLSFDEWSAIRLHDGMYEDANKSYKMKEPELALFLHWADNLSIRQEKNAKHE